MPTAYDSPADEHADLIQWALSEGIEIDAVAPIQFPGRGLGMVATRTIEENENILKVPVPLMLTIDSIPPSFVKKFPEGAPTHGILAAYFIHGDSSLLRKWDAWRKLWPQRHDFEDSMPILWPEHLRAFNSVSSDNTHGSCAILPPSASGLWNSVSKKSVDADYETKYQNLLSQQQTRLRHSWQNVINVFPDTDWDVFVYHWLIVGTRSFYYVTPGKEDPEDWADALGLIPVADYFNHSNDPLLNIDLIIDRGKQVH
ncbi:SET domain protein [Aspergillus sclerotialis]|uniref:SET domain protein n=1 Tax=Aspergillus sclerotialis TaxID=2070753 RepID=A0A3A2ZST0_9EURO|nr:SET domain protein [Aspergillus sclerotialis]